jgi:hypothetical protein
MIISQTPSPAQPAFIRFEAAGRTYLRNVAHIVSIERVEKYAMARLSSIDGSTVEMTLPEADAFEAALCRVATVAKTPRPAYRTLPDADEVAYLSAQKEMFKAARDAGLDTSDGELMCAALSEFIGEEITSRTQLTPDEMRDITAAIQRRHWVIGWSVRRGSMQRQTLKVRMV